MKKIIKPFMLFCLLTLLAFPQERPNKEKQMIITPDGKFVSPVDGSFIDENNVLNEKQNTPVDSPPIGTPHTWDNNL